MEVGSGRPAGAWARFREALKGRPVRNVGAALVVMVGGFVLFNLAFLLDALVHQVVARVYPSLGGPPSQIVFAVLIAVLSFFVLRARLPVLVKATYATVPLAVLDAGIGIAFYRWPVAVYGVGALLNVGILAYLSATKRHWLYAYAVVLVAVVLAAFTLFGGEI